KRAIEKDGYNLDIDYAKSQMKQTRELFSKNDGIQAHHVIQSFKPDEVTPEKANQVGLERSEEHTSELQSRFELVCRLLLDKKKIYQKDNEAVLMYSQLNAEYSIDT